MPKQRRTLWDGDTFEYTDAEGSLRIFRVEIDVDEFMQEPWVEHCGHGIVSEWTRRDKRPGERVLVEDRGSRRFYDVAATMKIAKRDGWGPRNNFKTPGENIAEAVNQDFEYLRRWCNDLWHWKFVTVTLLDEDGEETSESESLSGLDGEDDDPYIDEIAYELAEEISSRVSEEEEERRHWAERDVVTV